MTHLFKNKKLLILLGIMVCVALFAIYTFKRRVIYQNTEVQNFVLKKVQDFASHNMRCHNLFNDAKTKKVGIVKHVQGQYIALFQPRNYKLYMRYKHLELPLQQVIMSLLKKGDTYVEIGANHGNISLNAAEVVGRSGKVYSYEATSGMGDFLIPLSACLNGYEDFLTSKKVAIGNENKIVSFREIIRGNGYGNDVVSNDTKSSKQYTVNKIEMMTLDSILGDQDIDFLRLDVQGSECNIFEGANRILKSPNLKISFEWEPEFLNLLTKDFNPKLCMKRLQDAGFKYFWEVKGNFKVTDSIENTDVRIEKINMEEIIKMKSGDREFVATKTEALS